MIDYELEYPNLFKNIIDKGTATYERDFTADFIFDCPNDDCTAHGFDLYGKVASLIASGQTTINGIMECKGDEAKDHRHRCPSKLKYLIRLEYSKGFRSRSTESE